MTGENTVQLFAMIAALYPGKGAAFAAASPVMVKTWAKMLEDMPFELAQAGLQAHAANSPFPPTIAEIKARADSLTTNRMGADEAWELARKIIGRYGIYRKADAKANTDPEVWTVIERMGYRDLCTSENADVIRAQFMRIWDANAKRERETAMLPPAVRERAKQLTAGMALPEV